MNDKDISHKVDYAELVCFSNFSFLTGASTPEEHIEQAARLGYQALAITDECSVAGVVRAYSHIKQSHLDIKLIIGSYFNYQGKIPGKRRTLSQLSVC